MTKPDGIEQSIWKAADDLIEALETEFADFSRDGQLRGAYMDRQYQVIQTIIAQAITLAVKQERESIAKQILGQRYMPIDMRQQLSQAIRNRS